VTKRRALIVVAAILSAVGGIAAATGSASGGVNNFRASLTGYEETPAAISTPGAGSFSARQVSDGVYEYTLTFSGLEANSTQAHIHFGQRSVSGGIAIWLCSNLASPPTPPNTPACPLTGGTVTGTFSAASVVGPAGQGIDAGQLDEVVAAIDAGLAYCNVHSTKYLTGEVRGQIGLGSGPG
jgi:CHRD domain